MQEGTYKAVEALLRADDTLTPIDRREIAEAVKHHGQPKGKASPSIISRKETAKLLNRTVRSVDDLARQGALERVRLPGRQRACGFRRADVETLIAGES